MKIELWVALWGAVTGTFASCYNIRQWFLDRAKLKVEANIAIEHTDRLRVVLTISAVNVGRRPVSIRRVGAFLAETNAPIPQGLSPERSAEVTKIMRETLVSSELTLFGGREEKPIELNPDGGQHVWKCSLPERLKFLRDSKGDEEVGKAYVELTSGKRVFCDFLLLPDDK
ncbi:MAG: hypothetical protein ABSF10_17885 [Verrucomicrobiota bacterium]|jgi:hypothetical protein